MRYEQAMAMALRHQSAAAEYEDVTRDEFIRRAIAGGDTEEKAKFYANVSVFLGAYAYIGGKKLWIVVEQPVEQDTMNFTGSTDGM